MPLAGLILFQFYISTILLPASRRPARVPAISILHKYDSILIRDAVHGFITEFQFYISTILFPCG